MLARSTQRWDSWHGDEFIGRTKAALAEVRWSHRVEIGVAVRPLLVVFFSSFILGCQLVAIDFVGETIIFTHAKDNKEYKIKGFIHNNSLPDS